MADSIKKLINQLLDADGNEMAVSSAIVIDPASGKDLASMISGGYLGKTDEQIIELIDANVESLRTAVNTFLSGEPDDNGTIDRLKELVQAIKDNKDSIDDLIQGASGSVGGGSIDITTDVTAEATWDGKIRLVVSDFTVPAAS